VCANDTLSFADVNEIRFGALSEMSPLGCRPSPTT
jgi:hypothetical protein